MNSVTVFMLFTNPTNYYMKQLVILFTLLLFSSTAALAQSTIPVQEKTYTPIHQLRTYEIPKSNRKHFHRRFNDHAMRIMNKYGFKIIATWESEQENTLEFIYLLEWKDALTMKKAWADFMADQEWNDIKAKTAKQHGAYVTSVSEKILSLTEYSPQRVLR